MLYQRIGRQRFDLSENVYFLYRKVYICRYNPVLRTYKVPLVTIEKGRVYTYICILATGIWFDVFLIFLIIYSSFPGHLKSHRGSKNNSGLSTAHTNKMPNDITDGFFSYFWGLQILGHIFDRNLKAKHRFNRSRSKVKVKVNSISQVFIHYSTVKYGHT